MEAWDAVGSSDTQHKASGRSRGPTAAGRAGADPPHSRSSRTGGKEAEIHGADLMLVARFGLLEQTVATLH